MRPSSRDEFAIAIICALTLEAEAVEGLFDETYDRLGERYRKEPGDDNAYVNGRIGNHNVVVYYMPGMGKGSAASVASSLKISYKRIEVALVVGICGGAPYPLSGGEVFLGDVIISDSVVRYDFGRQYPCGFEKKLGVRDTLGRPNRAICSILASLQARRSRKDLQDKLLQHLQALQKSLMSKEICKTAIESPCTSLGCDMGRVCRRQPSTEHNSPRVHIGTVASADTVMQSGKHRDYLVQSEGIVGFEMEGAGVWDNISCIIIKGVCDYADSHKNKAWQAYAAATGAAAAKSFLEYWEPTAREDTSKFHIPLDLSAVPAIEEFIGREEELNCLWEYLQPASTQTRKVAVLHGLGGIGKTQLAIHFARKYKNKFTAIFWLYSKDQSSLVSSLSSCLSQIQEQPIEDQAVNKEEAVERANQVLWWLARPGNTRWLIIFDNIDQYSPSQGHGHCGYNVYEFFPKADHGSIMVTSRFQRLTELGKSFPVQKLMHKDAMQLLLQSSGFSAKDIARTGAEQDLINLASLLDGLSLAIVIAGAFMRQTGTTFKEYLELYRTSWFDLQSQSAPTRQYWQGNIIQTWIITYKEIQKHDTTAAKLLLLLAFFDNQDIWYELIRNRLDYSNPPPWFEAAVSSKLVFKTKIKALVEFSLVELKQQEGSYTLHPVLQDWCYYIAASNNLTTQLQELALISVGYTVPSQDTRDYARLEQRLLPHANNLIQRNIGLWLDILAEDRLNIFGAFHGLGILYSHQGKLKEAEEMYQRALAGREKALGYEKALANNLPSPTTLRAEQHNACHTRTVIPPAQDSRLNTLEGDLTRPPQKRDILYKILRR
ncbi:nucleoside phosphorylase domain-containing protein [Aspergillus tetrazonus]